MYHFPNCILMKILKFLVVTLKKMEKKFKFNLENFEDLDCHLWSLPLNDNKFSEVISTCVSFSVGAKWTDVEKCKCLKQVHTTCRISFFCNDKLCL